MSFERPSECHVNTENPDYNIISTKWSDGFKHSFGIASKYVVDISSIARQDKKDGTYGIFFITIDSDRKIVPNCITTPKTSFVLQSERMKKPRRIDK